MTLVPAFQTFAGETLGTDIFGTPDWALAARFVPPVPVIQATQIAIVLLGGSVALAMAWRPPARAAGKRESFPWLTLLALLIAAAIYLFLLPMEMRGSALGG